jgi:uncharacterized Zn finger protein
MNDPAARVVASCPACSVETPHEVLSPGGQATVRCTDCGHTHKTAVESSSTVERDVVVSQDGDSFAATTDVPADERLAVGEEFVLDTGEAILVVRITDLQIGDERRTDAAQATDVRTIWTRAVGNVSLNVTVHPADGDREGSRGVEARVPGNEVLVVGEERDLGDGPVRVEGLVIRDDARGYPARKLDRDGDDAPAKDCKRVYARATGGSRPAWEW